jgi:hypothetical protein
MPLSGPIARQSSRQGINYCCQVVYFWAAKLKPAQKNASGLKKWPNAKNAA